MLPTLEGSNLKRANHYPEGTIVVRADENRWTDLRENPTWGWYNAIHEPMHALLCDRFANVNWNHGMPYDVKKDYCEGKCYGIRNCMHLARNDPPDARHNNDSYTYWIHAFSEAIDGGTGYCWPSSANGRDWVEDPLESPETYESLDHVPGTGLNLSNDETDVKDERCH